LSSGVVTAYCSTHVTNVLAIDHTDTLSKCTPHVKQ